jgi:hypothetical protein
MSLTINLPPELERQLRDVAARQGRAPEDLVSAFVVAGLEADGAESDSEAVARYVRGYQQHPETDEELAETRAMLEAAADPGPWP